MIKEECKKASRFLCKLFEGDVIMSATIVTAEANNDYGTLRSMLLGIQDEIERLSVALKKLEDKACLEAENTEYDLGHNVNYNLDREEL